MLDCGLVLCCLDGKFSRGGGCRNTYQTGKNPAGAGTEGQVITKQFLHDWVTREAETTARVTAETRTMFETVVRGIIDYEPAPLFGMLAEVVAETKPRDEKGEPIKGGKADAATQTRMSELRQIYGAARGGWDWAEMVRRGREAAVKEARAFLQHEGLTAKGESIAVVKRRAENRKLGKAARELIESGEILTEEQREKVEAGIDLALVIKPEQAAALNAKAKQSVEAERIAKKIATWQKRADDLIDAMVEDGLGEVDLRNLLDRIVHRADAWLLGSDPRVTPPAELKVPGPALV